jgi:tetratricopeptide (TPR) repeat protein
LASAFACAIHGAGPRAIALLSAVLQDAPQEALAPLERGRAEYDAGDKQAARRDFEDYVKVTPDRPEGNLFLGILDYDARQYRSAIRHLNKAVALDPAQAETFYYLGQSLYCLGESAEAENALRKCLLLQPSDKAASELLERVSKEHQQVH